MIQMMNDFIKSMKLEQHETKDILDEHVNGNLMVVWRDWDKFIEKQPKMIYITSVNPGEKKGPHLHTIRDSYFVCIRGKVVFIVKTNDGQYKESGGQQAHDTEHGRLATCHRPAHCTRINQPRISPPVLCSV